MSFCPHPLIELCSIVYRKTSYSSLASDVIPKSDSPVPAPHASVPGNTCTVLSHP